MAKVLAILALACATAFDPPLEPVDDDYDQRHGSTLVARG
jgi:hypothetical protein